MRYNCLMLVMLIFFLMLCGGQLYAADLPVPEADSSENITNSENTQSILTKISELMSQRKYADALLAFENISSEEAANPRIQLIKASIHNSAGQSAKAREIANSILASQPENVEALLTLAAAALIEGKDKERRGFLDRVIKIDPQNLNALCDLGFLAIQGKSLKTAGNYFDRALAADAKHGDALVGRAIVYRYSSELKKSEQLLNKAVDLYPQWANPLHERARLYKSAGLLSDALADLDAAKKLEPDNYWISIDRGTVLFELSENQDALEEFSNAIILEPKNFLAYVYSAGLRDLNGDFDAAEKDYAMIMKLKPDYYYAAEGLGMIKFKKQEWAKARDAFLAAYKYAPKDYTYVLLAAVSWMRAGKMADPKQFLAQVLRTVTRDTAEWYTIRLFHDLSGDVDTAIRIENEKNLDTKTRMLFYLANYYDIRGNKSLADRYFIQVMEMDRQYLPEWRLNEWFIEQRGLSPK